MALANGSVSGRRLAKMKEVTMGAGTVLDSETAKAAIQVGAAFLLSPAVDPGVIRMCSQYGVVSIPGAFSPTEVTALAAGADIIKTFPATTLGPSHIQSTATPLSQAIFLRSSGVTVENFNGWFVKGVLAVGAEGYLTSTAASGDHGAITTKSKRLVERCQCAGHF